MQVVVALKEAAAVDESFEIRNETIPEEYLSFGINEWDEYALEAAVQLAEDGIADEVVTVTVGPERSEETIRKGLAKGADRAIRVWDEAIADQTFLDVGAKAEILGSVVEDLSPQLVLTGVQSDDEMFGATGVHLANRLDYGWAAVVNHLEIRPDEQELFVHRELEGGVEERTTVDLPALCTIQTGINEPRYASLRGIRMAQRAEIETHTLEDLGLSAETLSSSLTQESMVVPTTESSAELYEGEPAETAKRLATFLHDEGVMN